MMWRRRDNIDDDDPRHGREYDAEDAATPEEARSIEEKFAGGSVESGGSGSAEPIEMTDDAAALIETLQRERDDAVAARQRALADFANYQRRSRDNEIRAKQEGVMMVLRALLPVMDHFDLALAQDPSNVSVEQLLGGVKIVRAELSKVIETLGVTRIDPAPGDALDPQRHEAMMRQSAPGIEPGHVAAVFQPGYAVGDLIIRPAKVTVASE